MYSRRMLCLQTTRCWRGLLRLPPFRASRCVILRHRQSSGDYESLADRY